MEIYFKLRKKTGHKARSYSVICLINHVHDEKRKPILRPLELLLNKRSLSFLRSYQIRSQRREIRERWVFHDHNRKGY